jgi:hypothetical protein
VQRTLRLCGLEIKHTYWKNRVLIVLILNFITQWKTQGLLNLKKICGENMKKRGRPVKLLKDFDLPDNWKDIIFEMSAKGCSEVEIRARFCWDGVKFCHATWDKLKERDLEFLATIQKAKVLCQAWWEKVARVSLHDPDFQTGNWYANMKNRFGWRDKQEIEHTADNDLAETLAKYGTVSIQDFRKRIGSCVGGSN